MAVINDILDYARIGSGKLSLEDIDFDLEILISETIRLFTAQALEKQLSLHVGLEPGVPRRIRGDPTRLKQILMNLLSNALKFTEHGHVLLEVSSRQTQDGSRRLVFCVSDSGIGMRQRFWLSCSNPSPRATPAPRAAMAAAGWAWPSAKSWWK